MGERESAMVTLAPEEQAIAARVHEDLRSYRAEFAADGRGARETHVTSPQATLRVGTGSRCVVDVLKRCAVLNEGSAAKRFTDDVFRLDRGSLAGVLRGKGYCPWCCRLLTTIRSSSRRKSISFWLGGWMRNQRNQTRPFCSGQQRSILRCQR